MKRRERLLLLAFFTGVLVLPARAEPTASALGGVAGLAAGVVVARRARRLAARMDARLGAQERPTGFRLRRPLVRAGLHVAVLAGVVLSTVLVPFVGDELAAGLGAGVTALPLVVTAARLRR